MSDRYKLLEQCAFPTCDEPHDPRWGWYCDGHGVTTEEEWDSREKASRAALKDLRAQLAAEKAAREKAEKERDLAIAHDRQPYPTAWAYEQACKALDEWKARAQTARQEALEEAAGFASMMGAGNDVSQGIRALAKPQGEGQQ